MTRQHRRSWAWSLFLESIVYFLAGAVVDAIAWCVVRMRKRAMKKRKRKKDDDQ